MFMQDIQEYSWKFRQFSGSYVHMIQQGDSSTHIQYVTGLKYKNEHTGIV